MKPKKLIIVISGRQSAGKNYLSNCYAAHWIKWQRPDCDIRVGDNNDLIVDGAVIKLDGPNPHAYHERLGVRVFSFADQLKNFCVNVLGLFPDSCWGTHEQKNALTHIRWENMPLAIRIACSKSKWLGWWPGNWRSGQMTGREVMQVFGSEIIRAIYDDAWAFATMNAAANSPHQLAIVCDGRFPNEMDIQYKMGLPACIRTARLLRRVNKDAHISETALDGYPLAKFSRVYSPDVTRHEYWLGALADLTTWRAEADLNIPVRQAP